MYEDITLLIGCETLEWQFTRLFDGSMSVGVFGRVSLGTRPRRAA